MALTAAQRKLIEENPPDLVQVEALTKPGRQSTKSAASTAIQTPAVKIGGVNSYVDSQLANAPRKLDGTPITTSTSTKAFVNPLAPGAQGSPASAHVTTPTTRLEMRKRADQSGGAQVLKDALARIGHETASSVSNMGSAAANTLGMYLDYKKGFYDTMREGVDGGHAPTIGEDNPLYPMADKLNDYAGIQHQKATEGASAVGKLALDVYGQAVPMAADAVVGAASGGSSLIPLAIRAFGSSAQEARRDGADFNKSTLYGAGNAAVEVMTEKMFDGLAGIYGKGGADEIVEKVIDKLAKSDKGRNALKIVSSMGGEALEEIVSGIIDPALKSIYNGKSVGQNYTKDTVAEIAYSALIGGILGGLGGSVDLARGNVPNLDTAPRKLDGTPIGTDVDPRFAAPEQTARAQAQTDNAPRKLDGTPILPTNGVRTGTDTTGATGANLGTKNAPDGAGVKAGRVTTIYNPYQGTTPVQTKASGETVHAPSEAYSRAEALMEEARSLDASGAGGFKTMLTRLYQRVFQRSSGVPVSEMTYNGKPYLVEIGNKVPGKVISDPNLQAEKLALLDILPQVVQNAQYVGSGEYVAENKKASSAIRYDYFETPVEINGRDYIAKFDVEVLPGANNYRTHQIVNVDLTTPTASLVGPAPTASVGGSSPLLNNTVTQTSNVVNSDRAPRMLNGEPTRAVSNLDTSGGTRADMAPRMINGTVEKGFQNAYPDDYLDMAAEYANPVAQRTNADELISAKTEKQRKSLAEKAGESLSYFKRKMLDSGEAVTREAKATGDKHLYAYYNLARASTNAATSMITEGASDIRGRRTGKSLNDIFGDVRSKGDDYYNAFQAYLLHLHNIDRMSRDNRSAVNEAEAAFASVRADYPELLKFADHQIENMALNENSEYHDEAVEYVKARNKLKRAESVTNKPVFGYDVSAEDSMAAAAELARQHPEFADKANEVYGYIDNLMRYRVDSGLITEEDYQHLKEIYPHYVPTYRIFEQDQAGGKRGKGVKIGKTIGTATGGNQKIMPLHEALAKQTMSVVREGSKNRFGQRMLNSEKSAHILSKQEYDGTFSEDLFDELRDSAETFTKENSFIVRENGKMYEMTVTPAMFEAVKALSPDREEVNAFTRVVRGGNDLFKRLVTGDNPVFLARNFMRDLQDAGIYSKDLSAFAANYPQAIAEIKNDGEYWQMYKALGGTYSSIFDFETGNVDEHAAWRKNTLDRIEALNEAVEQAPRLAEFMATVKKNGGLNADMDTLMDAMYNAADVTVNFGRSGTLGKKLNANYIPFLNPGIQGFDKMVRTFTETKGAKDWLRLAAKCAILGIAPRVISELMYRDDDEWDDIRDSDKDSYYLFKVKDGLWVKLPKGRTLSVIGAGADRIADAARSEDVDAGAYAEFLLTQTAPANPLKENILRAWFDADLLNKESPGRTWYGSDIENQRLRNYAPEERYDARTDEASKWLGQKLGLSPKKINYLLDQYSGVVGDVLLPLMTPTAERDMFSAAFTLDSAASNKLSNDFYEAKDALTYAKNGKEATGADAVTYKWISKQGSAVSEVNAEIRKIEADPDLSDKEKKELLHAQYIIRNTVEREALATQDAYKAAAQKYYDASDAEKESDRIDEAYREANREIYGAEYALRTYNKDVYENAAALNEQGVSWDDFYNVYFGMKAHKDLKGYEKSNADRDVIRESELPEETKYQIYEALIDKEGSRADEYKAFQEAGLGIDKFLQAQNAYARINENVTGAQAKAQEFARWVNYLNLPAEQADVMKQSFVYFSQIKQEGTKYDELLGSGLTDRQSYDLANSIRALEPLDGKEGVSNLQKYQVVVSSGLTDDEQMQALSTLMEDAEYNKVQIGYTYGVTPTAYVAMKELLPQYNADGNTSYTQAEVKAAIDHILVNGEPLATEQKAALWQMASKSWKGKNNPYSTRVGWQVYDAMRNIKIEEPPKTLYAAPEASSGSALDRIMASGSYRPDNEPKTLYAAPDVTSGSALDKIMASGRP